MNISLKLDTSQPDSDNKLPLYVRIRGKNSEGKRRESLISTGLHVESNHIKSGSLKTGIKGYSDKQRIINSIISDLEHILSVLKNDGHEPSPKLLKKKYQERVRTRELNTPKVETFWGAFQEFIDSKKHLSRGYVKTFKTLRNRIRDFEDDEGITITYDFIIGNTLTFESKFKNYLWGERELTNSYVNKLLKNLSQFLHYSKKQNYIKSKPSFKMEDTVDRMERIYLYENEVHKLYKSTKWDYEEGKSFDNPHIIIREQELKGMRSERFGGILKVTNWELVKDIFLFQCSIGCRYSDIPHFRVNHFDFNNSKGDKPQTFSWIQQKTDKRVTVPENDINGYIYRKYSSGKSLSQKLFPSLSIQKFNKGLKLLLKDLGFNRRVSHPRKIGSKKVDTDDKFLWELISSHAGRRSFIKNMIDIGTMDYKTIMSMSGHRTMKEFLKYTSVTKRDLKKGTKLYRLEDKETGSEVDELLEKFVELDDDKRKLVLNMVRNLQS